MSREVGSEAADVPAELIIDTTDLGPLLTGYKSAEELYLHGRLKLAGENDVVQSTEKLPENVRELGKLFPPLVTFNAEEW